MNILRYIAFSKIFLIFCSPSFCFLQLWKISPPGQEEVSQGSRKSASGVKEKCVVRQGKVCQGSRRSAWAEYHTFSRSIFPWPPMPFSLTPDSLLLDPRRTSPNEISLLRQNYFVKYIAGWIQAFNFMVVSILLY